MVVAHGARSVGFLRRKAPGAGWIDNPGPGGGAVGADLGRATTCMGGACADVVIASARDLLVGAESAKAPSIRPPAELDAKDAGCEREGWL